MEIIREVLSVGDRLVRTAEQRLWLGWSEGHRATERPGERGPWRSGTTPGPREARELLAAGWSVVLAAGSPLRPPDAHARHRGLLFAPVAQRIEQRFPNSCSGAVKGDVTRAQERAFRCISPPDGSSKGAVSDASRRPSAPFPNPPGQFRGTHRPDVERLIAHAIARALAGEKWDILALLVRTAEAWQRLSAPNCQRALPCQRSPRR